MMAQYSIPFCVALSLYFDPSDPASFDEGKLADRNILKMMAKVRLKVDHEIEAKGWDRAARVSVDLGKRGRHNKLVIHFKGTPGNPMTGAEVQAKAQKLTGSILSPRQFARLVETVAQLEKLSDSAKLGAILRTAQ
jgi:2-methylcitrate dehydratase PrpD